MFQKRRCVGMRSGTKAPLSRLFGAVLFVTVVWLLVGPAVVGAEGTQPGQEPGDGLKVTKLSSGQEVEVGSALKVSLADAVARQNSPSVLAAAARRNAARTSYERVKEMMRDIPDSLITVFDSSVQTSPGIGGMQALGARQTYLARRQAESGKVLAEAGYDLALRSAVLEAYGAYLGVLKAERVTKVSEQNLARARAQLELAQKMEKAGVVPHKDVIDAEVGVANAEAQLTGAKKGLEIARLNLNKALGIDLDRNLELVDSFNRPSEPGLTQQRLDEDTAYALQNRFEMIQASENQAVAEYELELAKRYLTPNTYLYREVSYRVQEAAEQKKLREKETIISVREAYLGVCEAWERLAAYDKALAAASESYRLAELRYKNGITTSIEVVNAQTALLNAETQSVGAIYDYYLARARYDFAVGRGSVET